MTTGKGWDSLATLIDSNASVTEILSAANANYTVELTPVLALDPALNTIVTIDKRFVTCRKNPDGTHYDHWEVVKDRYEIVQNADILARAFNVVERSQGSAFLHSCGVLDDGRKFFVAISTGGLTIGSGSNSDDIDSYMVVFTSHDGSIPVCYYNLDVRRKTNAVYRISSNVADFSLRKRHTPNESDSAVEASEALTLRREWSNSMRASMSSLMAPSSLSVLGGVIEQFWSTTKATTEKQRDHAEMVRETILDIYNADYNVGIFGQTKWSFFNAITEYIDFHRNIDPYEAAQHSLEIDNYSHRLKLSVYKHLVSA